MEANFYCFPLLDIPTPAIGVYYYPWWDDATYFHWPDGYLREKLSVPQEPWLGRYSVQNTTVIDQHLEWANQYGISQFIASWWGAGTFEDSTIRDFLLPSSSIGNIQVGLLYESLGLLKSDENDTSISFDDGGANAQKLISDFEYMAETYFRNPKYLKVDGKPVVYFYVTRIFTGNYKQAFENLRSHILANYGYDLYLVGDEVYWGVPNADRINTFDAITAYNMHGPAIYDGYPEDTKFLSDVEGVYREYQNVTEGCRMEVDFIPGVIPAFNDRGVRLETDHYVIPHEVRADLAGTGQYTTFQVSLAMAYRVLQERSSSSRHSPVIMVTSWNEWHEDTNIEPTKGTAGSSSTPFEYTEGYSFDDYGFGLLEVIPRFLSEVSETSSGTEVSESSSCTYGSYLVISFLLIWTICTLNI